MPLWRLKPHADESDSRWLDHPRWEEVIVRAPTAALARRVAASLERPEEPVPPGNESLPFRSGFEDEKLYHVAPLDSDEAPGLSLEGPDAVIREIGPESPEA